MNDLSELDDTALPWYHVGQSEGSELSSWKHQIDAHGQLRCTCQILQVGRTRKAEQMGQRTLPDVSHDVLDVCTKKNEHVEEVDHAPAFGAIKLASGAWLRQNSEVDFGASSTNMPYGDVYSKGSQNPGPHAYQLRPDGNSQPSPRQEKSRMRRDSVSLFGCRRGRMLWAQTKMTTCTMKRTLHSQTNVGAEF